MGDVFDRWRLNCGWNPWDNDTQGMAISSFVHTLDRAGVPASAYNELYERVLLIRANAIQNDKKIPQFGSDLMLAAWLGEGGLQSELRQREIDARRTLGANAASVCQHCYGTTFRKIDPTDRNSPVRKCDHGEI